MRTARRLSPMAAPPPALLRRTPPAGAHIGTAIAATDADNDTLTYTLSGADCWPSFEIDATTGQLKTKGVLDYETKRSYTVTVTVSDGNGGSDTITVTINITDVAENSAPAVYRGRQYPPAQWRCRQKPENPGGHGYRGATIRHRC